MLMEVASSRKLKLTFTLISCSCMFVTYFAQAADISIRNCGSNEPIKLKDFTITYGRDKDSSAKAFFSIGGDIAEGAYADVTIKIGLVKLIQKTFDICRVARERSDPQTSCPISPGDYALNIPLPSGMPRARFVVNMRMYDVEDNDVGCVDLIIDTRNVVVSL